MLGVIVELGTPVVVLQSQLALLMIRISPGRQRLVHCIRVEVLVWSAVRLVVKLPPLMMPVRIVGIHPRSCLPN